MCTNTQAEELASRILNELEDAVCIKLKELKDDLKILRTHFKNLKRGDSIAGCKTWAQFCSRKLHRTDRAVRKLLEQRAEKSSAEPEGENSSDGLRQKELQIRQSATNGEKPDRTIDDVDAENLEAATRRTLAYFKPLGGA